MKIEVVEIKDVDDGGALVTVDMDYEMILAMAKVGLVRVLTDAARTSIEEHGKENGM